MKEHIDLDVAPILTNMSTIEAMGNKLFELLKETVNGGLTKAEQLGFGEFAINRIGPTL
jgi:altronate dehydratase